MNENIVKRNRLLAQKVIKGLASRNMTGYYAEDRPAALTQALALIPEHAAVTMVILEQVAFAEDVQQFSGITIVGYVMSFSVVGYLRDLVIVVAIVDSISYLSTSGLDSLFEQSFRVHLINLGADCLGDSGDNLFVQCFLLLVCEHMRM